MVLLGVATFAQVPMALNASIQHRCEVNLIASDRREESSLIILNKPSKEWGPLGVSSPLGSVRLRCSRSFLARKGSGPVEINEETVRPGIKRAEPTATSAEPPHRLTPPGATSSLDSWQRPKRRELQRIVPFFHQLEIVFLRKTRFICHKILPEHP